MLFAPPIDTLKLDNFFTVTADFSSATWNTVGLHEIATVTGMVHMVIIPELVTDLDDGGLGTAFLSLGQEPLGSNIIGATAITNFQTTNEGLVWVNTSSSSRFATRIEMDMLDIVSPFGYDIGYEISVAALTAGLMKFHIYWESVGSGGSVVAGLGGTL